MKVTELSLSLNLPLSLSTIIAITGYVRNATKKNRVGDIQMVKFFINKIVTKHKIELYSKVQEVQ